MPSFDSLHEYTRVVLRKTVASHCQAVGWQHISATALDVLCDLLRHYVLSAARRTAAYSRQAGRCLTNLDDAALALADLGVCMRQLESFVDTVESPPFVATSLPPVLPVQHESRFNFLRPGSQEIVTRPIHIYEYLPPMLFETATAATDAFDNDSSMHHDSSATASPLKTSTGGFGMSTAINSPSGKRLGLDGSPLVDSPSKRARAALTATACDDTGVRPVRELSSLMMTTSGFISPAVEGKMPEGRMPEDLDDQRDGHGRLITRKQRADTYRRMSERENERKNRERELWSNEDMFDIIDVKVEDDSGNVVSSPEKSSGNKDTFSRRSKPVKKRTFASSSSRHKKTFPISKFSTKSSEGKNKLSIFKKKSKVKPSKLREPVVPKKMKDTKRRPKVPASQVHHATVPSPVIEPPVLTTPLKLEKDDENFSDSNNQPSSAKTIDSIAPLSDNRSESVCDQPKEPTRIETATDSETAQTTSSAPAVAESVVSRPHTPVSEGHERSDDPVPDTSSLLNNPLIPRYPFPFGSGSDNQVVAPTPAFLPMFSAKKSPQGTERSQEEEQPEPSVSQPEKHRSPSVDSNVSDRSRSFSPPVKRPVLSGGLTPLERLEMADRAEKKKCKEHKKNKKDKKEKRKKDKKDRDKRDKDEKTEKKKKRLEKASKEDEVVPKLTVRIGTHDSCAEVSPCESSVQSPPRLIIKPVKETSPKATKKSKSAKKIDIDFRSTSPLVEDVDKTIKREKETKPTKFVKEKTPKAEKSGPGRKKKSAPVEPARDSSPDSCVDEPAAIITETVGSYIDSEGNKVWICPTCGRQDDGSPMIGCDKCDDWYHWVCVGIQVPPDQHEDWYCPRCAARAHDATTKSRGRGRGRKKH